MTGKKLKVVAPADSLRIFHSPAIEIYPPSNLFLGAEVHGYPLAREMLEEAGFNPDSAVEVTISTARGVRLE
jgi:hypothetical protein